MSEKETGLSRGLFIPTVTGELAWKIRLLILPSGKQPQRNIAPEQHDAQQLITACSEALGLPNQ